MEHSEYPWGHSRRFNAYSGYFKKLFGERIQKVTIDAGFTCPNRDGTKGMGGCTFCNNDSFNPSYCTPDKSISQQIDEGLEFHASRYKGTQRFLAYFQAYSNTYGPLELLKQKYNEAIDKEGIVGLVIGTRPDCIDREKLKYFKELSEKIYLTLEYGIESCYDKTLQRVNRGHTFNQTLEAIHLTAEYGIKTGAHLIFGLPGETRDMMLNEAGIISELPLTTVKFHQLQIIKNTRVAKDYDDHPEDFNLFEFDEYLDFLVNFVEKMNPEIVIERIAGEAPPRHIHAGKIWNLRYDRILDAFEKKLEQKKSWQGKFYKK